MKAADNTRQRILDAAYTLFYQRGFARVGVDEVASAAKVTKRTLYYHFKSKDQLLAAMLEGQHERALAHIEKQLDRYPDDVDQFVTALFSDFAKWMAAAGWPGAGFTRLAIELADLPGHPARKVAHRHKLAVEDWWSGVLAEANVPMPAQRARELVLLLEGANALMVIHKDRSYADAAAEAVKTLIRRAPKRRSRRGGAPNPRPARAR
jgi:AcrR family transcriptional regulator